MSFTGTTTGSGNGSVGYSVAANSSTSARTGTLTIAGQTFTVSQAGVACSYAISPTSNPSVVAGGATGTVNVTAQTGCAWSSTSNAAWITFSGTPSGSGNGSINYSVAANTSSSSRTGTLTVAGQTFTVTQAGVACSYAISPTSNPSVVAGGATGTVNVTAPSGCTWSSTSNDAWITFSGATTGSGNGAINYAVAANSSSSSRTGTLTIAGQTFTVTQAGVACSYAISPTSNPSVVAGGGTGTVTVTAQTGCTWSSTSNAAWITFSGSSSGSGNGSVGYSVASNTSSSSRTGTLTIAGQTFTVTQAGTSCTGSISPANATVLWGDAASGTVTVTAAAGCSWSSTSNATWLTFSGASSGTGNGTVSYSVAANDSTTGRSGTMTIAGQTFTVDQGGASCGNYSISPTSTSVSGSATTGSVAVTAPTGCVWSAISNVGWMSFSGSQIGNGNGSVNYVVDVNTGAPRSGTLTVAGQTFTVNQGGVGCSYAISPTSNSVAAGGATGSVNVTAAAGCSWSSTSNAAWITFSGTTTGSGNGSINYSVASNTSSSPRTGTLTIAGQTFTVDQAPTSSSCTASISPSYTWNLWGDGASGTVTVTAPAGCSWSSTSNVAWLTFSGTSSGTGNGTVGYVILPNDSTTGRSGTMTIAGQTFAVDQGGAQCGNYTISPTSVGVSGSAATGSVAVTAPTGCVWSAVSNVAWVSFSGSQIGNGNGSVSYVVEANNSGAPRSGTLTVAGRTFTVNQAASTSLTASSCTYTLSPATQSIAHGGGTASATVTTTTGCTWTAVSNATSWITVTSGASGDGNGTVKYSVAANPDNAARSGSLTIGGKPVTVNQPANPCAVTLTANTRTMNAASGSGAITFTVPAGCAWTVRSNASWITATGTGTGSGSVNYSVTSNTTSASRTGTVNVGASVFTINQDSQTGPQAPNNLRFKGGQ
jgi:hypothetical protein